MSLVCWKRLASGAINFHKLRARSILYGDTSKFQLSFTIYHIIVRRWCTETTVVFKLAEKSLASQAFVSGFVIRDFVRHL